MPNFEIINKRDTPPTNDELFTHAHTLKLYSLSVVEQMLYDCLFVFCARKKCIQVLEQHVDELMMTDFFLIVIIWVEYPFDLCSLKILKNP